MIKPPKYCRRIKPPVVIDQASNYRITYLAYLAVKRKVSASTQNQTFCAIIAFCRSVLRLDPHPSSQFCHTPLLNGVDLHQIPGYLGHANVETTISYTHVIKDMRSPGVSPLDVLDDMCKKSK